jgi:mercuric reductase
LPNKAEMAQQERSHQSSSRFKEGCWPDLLVVGSGSAGVSAAIEAKKLGASVIVVERSDVGGTCLNRGCLPSKYLLYRSAFAPAHRSASTPAHRSASTPAHRSASTPPYPSASTGAREHSPSGIFEEQPDLNDVQNAKAALIEEVREARYLGAARSWKFEILKGQAEFVDPERVSVDGRLFCPYRVVIATGSRPSIPSIEGLEAVEYLTSDEVLSLRDIPQSCVVIGAGFVGLELSQLLANLGCRVTVVGKVMPTAEPELAAALRDALAEDGIDFVESRAVRVEAHGGSLLPPKDLTDEGSSRSAPGKNDGGLGSSRTGNPAAAADSRKLGERGRPAQTESPSGKAQIAGPSADRPSPGIAVVCEDGSVCYGERLIVATGRVANTKGMGLEKAGVALDENGSCLVDSSFRTSNPKIYAAGDAAKGPKFVYVAARQGAAAAKAALEGRTRPIDYTGLPSVLFTEPQLAQVGLTEREAKRRGLVAEAFFYDGSDVARPKVEGLSPVLVKLVVETGSHRLLGIHVLARGAGELAFPASLAVGAGMRAEDLAEAWCPYLTLSEILREAVRAYLDPEAGRPRPCCG